MTSPIDAPQALSYVVRLVPIGHETPCQLVSQIFSIKVADTQIDTSTDNNKGRLKFSSRASQQEEYDDNSWP